MKRLILLYAALMSLAAFIAFGLDKHRAKTDAWRIPERTLFLLAGLGGGFGAYLGMQVFHHKTLHKNFVIGIPVIMITQLVLLAVLFTVI